MTSHNCSAGNPSRRTAALAATISASGVPCETHVCFLGTPFNGKKVCGPVRAIHIPVVDFDESYPQRNLYHCQEIKQICQMNLLCGPSGASPMND